MKTDFGQWRKRRATGMKIAVATAVPFACWAVAGGSRSGLGMAFCALSLGVSAFSLAAWRCTKCPHCGESVFSKWGSSKMAKRIANRKPVLCAHCGEEVDAD